MLPHGKITEDTIAQLAGMMSKGDIIIDGGNTYYKDDVRRGKELAAKGLRYLDVGTSGGVWGLERGYCLMIGGDTDAVQHLDPIFKALAPGIGTIERTPGREGHDPRAEEGYIHAGPVGAGHFVKMIHNGIEYGMMQAMAEGFDILKAAPPTNCRKPSVSTSNVADIAEVWRRGSVVTSWLLDLTSYALAKDERSTTSPARSRIPAKAAGRSRRRSRKRSPPMCSPRRCSPASAPASRTPSRKKSSPRCASASAAMWNRRRNDHPRRHGRVRQRQDHDRRGLADAGGLDPAGGRFVPPSGQRRQDDGRHPADR